MANETERVRERLASPYRMACPRGHTSLRVAETTPSAYCQMCDRSYAFDDLVDRRLESDG